MPRHVAGTKRRAPRRRQAAPKRQRRAPRIVGHGSYRVKGGAAAGRSRRPRRVGSGLGRSVARFAGAAASALLSGHGTYKVAGNTLINGGAIPSFQSAGDGVRICHREYLADVLGTTGFSLSSYAVQPGLTASFPWLATCALAFEEYRLNGLVYEYRSTSGTAVSTTSAALGSVILATQYNPYEPAFASKQEMDSYEYSTSTSPCENALHAVECAPALNPLSTQFIRNGSVPSGADERLYDVGTFTIATSGQQSAYVVGELWVSYDITLRKPRIDTTSTASMDAQFAHVQCSYGQGLFDSTTAVPFGLVAQQIPTSASSLPIADYFVNGTTLQLYNPGTYLVTVYWTDAVDTLSGAPTASVGTAIVSTNPLYNNGGAAYTVFTSHSACHSALFHVGSPGTGSGNTITYTGPAGMTVGGADIWITCTADYIKP
jgi:hypothetical protein